MSCQRFLVLIRDPSNSGAGQQQNQCALPELQPSATLSTWWRYRSSDGPNAWHELRENEDEQTPYRSNEGEGLATHKRHPRYTVLEMPPLDRIPPVTRLGEDSGRRDYGTIATIATRVYRMKEDIDYLDIA